MQKQLTTGPVMPTMLQFAVPMILGDLLQQCYNIADTLIVGRFIGTGALAAVGSAFTLMTFLTSILLGLAMGSGTVFSIKFGQKDDTGGAGVCCVRRVQRHYLVPAHPCRDRRHDADVPAHRVCGAGCDISL